MAREIGAAVVAIVLNGRQLMTLMDAGDYITEPSEGRALNGRMAGSDGSLDAGRGLGGSTMFARIDARALRFIK